MYIMDPPLCTHLYCNSGLLQANIDYPEPEVSSWWSWVSSTDNSVNISVLYIDGHTYTSADQYVWTLPDSTTLTPGSTSADGFQALAAKVNVGILAWVLCILCYA